MLNLVHAARAARFFFKLINLVFTGVAVVKGLLQCHKHFKTRLLVANIHCLLGYETLRSLVFVFTHASLANPAARLTSRLPVVAQLDSKAVFS